MNTSTVDPQARAGRREWTASRRPDAAAAAGLHGRVGALLRRPVHHRATCDPTATQQLWIFDIYGFVLAGLLITMGVAGRPDRPPPAAADRRRRLRRAPRVAAAYAASAETLIAARALLGIGGATLMPSTLALIRNMFHDDKQRGHRHRGLVRRAHRRRRARPGPQRHPARALLVGLGLPDQRAGHAAAARARADAGARVPPGRRRPLRPARRGAVAGRGAAGDLRRQGDRRRRRRSLAGRAIVAGLAVGAAFLHRQRTSPTR